MKKMPRTPLRSRQILL